MRERVSFRWVKEKFFSDPEKTLRMRKGEVLLEQNQKNQKLYLVLEGKFHGYLMDSDLKSYPVLEAGENKFIGVYSYFSDDNKSYSRVVAAEDSVISYYDKALHDHSQEEWSKLAPFLISVVTNELFSRQYFSRNMAIEKYHYEQKLLKAEKMATLGQMAAGLAHELNNAIGVVSGGTDHLEKFITDCISKQKDGQLRKIFLDGLTRGQDLSSEEARKVRKNFEGIRGISASQARKLSKTGIDPYLVKIYTRGDPEKVDELLHFWDAGTTLHAMKIASRHSTHVVRSVKQLGNSEHTWSKGIDINNTIQEALIILKNLTKRVHLDLKLDKNLPPTEGYVGQLIQAWINLVKNGIESMLGAKESNPTLHITSDHDDHFIRVSIIDNGPGISDEIIHRIFEPSFTTKVGGLSFGLGLGLSIVQRVVTEHDGQVTVKSVPGETTFTIQLPIIK